MTGSDGVKRLFKRNSEATESRFACKRGDLTIRGTEYRPAGERLPVAIVCHGFMANQDTVRHYAKELAGMGYCAYCFDFCGGSALGMGKSDGMTTEMSVLTQMQDLEAVIVYARSLPYTGEKLLLMGGSQGGFVAALVAAKLRQEVDRLALLFPALCIPDDARRGKMLLASFDPEQIPQTIHCGPMKLGRRYVSDVIGMDPIREIAAYPGPVLIIHGTKDAIVPLEYSQRAQQAYPNGQLCVIEGGGHGFAPKHDRVAIEQLRRFAGSV